MCVDKLWDTDYSMTPYHYSHNNPVCRLDANGLLDDAQWMDAVSSGGYQNGGKEVVELLRNDYVSSGLGLAGGIAGIAIAAPALVAAGTTTTAVLGTIGLMGSIEQVAENSTKLISKAVNGTEIKENYDFGAQTGIVADRILGNENNELQNFGSVLNTGSSFLQKLPNVTTSISYGVSTLSDGMSLINQGSELLNKKTEQTSKENTNYNPEIKTNMQRSMSPEK